MKSALPISLTALPIVLSILATGCHAPGAGEGTDEAAPSVKKAEVFTAPVTGLAFIGNDDLVSIHSDSTLRIWGVNSGAVKSEQKNFNAPLAISSASGVKLIAGVGAKNTLKIWDVGKSVLRKAIKLAGNVSALAFSKNGQRLGVAQLAGKNSNVKIFRVFNGQLEGTCAEIPGRVSSLDFAPSASALLVAGGQELSLWKWQTGRKLRSLFVLSELPAAPVVARFSASGQRISVSHGDRVLLFQGDFSGTPQSIRLHPQAKEVSGDRVQSMAFSPDGTSLAIGVNQDNLTSTDRHIPTDIQIWDLKTWKPKAILKGIGPCYELAYSPDGKHLASGGDQGNGTAGDPQTGQVCVFSTATGQREWCSIENASNLK